MKANNPRKSRVPEKVISSVKASMAFEGLKPSLQAQAIGKEYLEGKISGKVAAARIKENHSSKFIRHYE
ncbi:MAG: antitoxin VbhA family protein [Ruminiclostridium sp.]